MSRRYAPDHKELVLRVFALVFDCNAVATREFTGIPARTIRDWYYADLEAMKREYAPAAGTSPAPADAAAPNANLVRRR
jgi:hypothetical protein